jgi:rhodanese-related sulfurtransferase
LPQRNALITALAVLVFAFGILPDSFGDEDIPKTPKAPPEALKGAKLINVEQCAVLSEDTNAVVLDVRTSKEFKEGHIPGATNIDYLAPDFDAKLKALDKAKPYVLHCSAGGRSSQAAARMLKAGFTNVIYFEAGMNGWQKAGKKVER